MVMIMQPRVQAFLAAGPSESASYCFHHKGGRRRRGKVINEWRTKGARLLTAGAASSSSRLSL